jgi:type VI secretion system protein ImpK
MSDQYGRGGRGGRGPRDRRPRFEDEDGGRDGQRERRPRFEDLDDQDEPAPRRARPARAEARRPARPARRPAAPGFFARLFGTADRPRLRHRGREEYDWDYAQDEDEDRRGSGQYSRESWDEDDRGERRPRTRKLSLMDLCTPVFAYSSMLPRDAGGMHPSYGQFRQEVLAALQRIETEAPEHGVDREDAQDAVYALCLFLDQDIATSEWSGKGQWANEPLYAVKLQDPEGGINFFRRLDEMGNRRREVKEVFLVCLSMGFTGKYAELEPAQQAAKLGEIRQRVLRSIHATPLDNVDELFPEAYEAAEPLVDDVPPPPKWWITASFAVVAVAVISFALLLWAAHRAPREPARQLKAVTVSEATR